MHVIPLVLGILLLATNVVADPTSPLSRPTRHGGIHRILELDKARARSLSAREENQAPDSRKDMPLSHHVDHAGIRYVVKHDQARAKFLSAREDKGKPHSHTEVISQSLVKGAYVADIEIGSTKYSVIVDTGSSNTWVGANPSRPYCPSSTSKALHNVAIMQYGIGYMAGTQFNDEVTLAPGLAVKQSISAAVASNGSAPLDGILGLGPARLTVGTLFPEVTKEIPTVIDNLQFEGKIPSRVLGVYLEPYNPANRKTGLLTYGGTPTEKAKGEIHYAPVTTRGAARDFWGVDLTVEYGSTTILSNSNGIVDTGTTLILLATDAFEKYKKMTGAKDSDTGLLRITPSQFKRLKPLDFIINGRSFNLVPDAQIWPRTLNKAIGGDPDGIYLVTADIGVLSTHDSEKSLFCIIGLGFLQRFLTVYDTDNHRVGFAKTEHTDHEMNYMT